MIKISKIVIVASINNNNNNDNNDNNNKEKLQSSLISMHQILGSSGKTIIDIIFKHLLTDGDQGFYQRNNTSVFRQSEL